MNYTYNNLSIKSNDTFKYLDNIIQYVKTHIDNNCEEYLSSLQMIRVMLIYFYNKDLLTFVYNNIYERFNICTVVSKNKEELLNKFNSYFSVKLSDGLYNHKIIYCCFMKYIYTLLNDKDKPDIDQHKNIELLFSFFDDIIYYFDHNVDTMDSNFTIRNFLYGFNISIKDVLTIEYSYNKLMELVNNNKIKAEDIKIELSCSNYRSLDGLYINVLHKENAELFYMLTISTDIYLQYGLHIGKQHILYDIINNKIYIDSDIHRTLIPLEVIKNSNNNEIFKKELVI